MPEVRVDHGEKQRLTVLAAGRKDRGGLEQSIDSDESRRPQAASNHGVEMPEEGFEFTRLYRQGILCQQLDLEISDHACTGSISDSGV